MMCHHDLHLYDSLQHHQGSNLVWGHVGAHHLYSLAYERTEEFTHRYARGRGHFDTSISPLAMATAPPPATTCCEDTNANRDFWRQRAAGIRWQKSGTDGKPI